MALTDEACTCDDDAHGPDGCRNLTIDDYPLCDECDMDIHEEAE